MSLALTFTHDELAEAEDYFFKKATKEVYRFSNPREYKNNSLVKKGILLYSGRILEGQAINDVEKIMSDIIPLSFVRPIIDRYSPVAYSIMLYAHNELVHHRNTNATLNES